MQKNCEQCGKFFTPKRSNQIYCCVKCTKRACYLKNKKKYNNASKLRYYKNHEAEKEKRREYYYGNKDVLLEKAKEYYCKNREKIIEDVTEWRRRHPEKVRVYNLKYNAINRSEINERYCERECGGLWKKTMARDGYKCRVCESNEMLVVHHLDGNHKNNVLPNLMVLCKGCHLDIHREDLLNGKRIKKQQTVDGRAGKELSC